MAMVAWASDVYVTENEMNGEQWNRHSNFQLDQVVVTELRLDRSCLLSSFPSFAHGHVGVCLIWIFNGILDVDCVNAAESAHWGIQGMKMMRYVVRTNCSASETKKMSGGRASEMCFHLKSIAVLFESWKIDAFPFENFHWGGIEWIELFSRRKRNWAFYMRVTRGLANGRRPNMIDLNEWMRKIDRTFGDQRSHGGC